MLSGQRFPPPRRPGFSKTKPSPAEQSATESLFVLQQIYIKTIQKINSIDLLFIFAIQRHFFLVMKINLLNLEQHLFPDVYPFYREHFKKEKEFLNSKADYDKLNYQNIKFKLKLSELSLNIKNSNVRAFVFSIYDKLFTELYDYDKEYDWHDLKLLLCYFILIKDATNIKKLDTMMNNPHTMRLLRKYKPRNLPVS